MQPAPKKTIPLMQLSTVEPLPLEWLWYPYIPIGVATMLFGQGGIGKSTLSVEITSALTTGRSLPGQLDAPVPQNVLILSAEDDLARVLVPRLMANGADLTKIYAPSMPFTLDKDGFRMMREYMKVASAAVVFIDPVVSWMGGRLDMHKMNEVRAFTGPLQQIAEETHSAIIMVHHTRKSKDGAELDHEKAAGSADFTNAVRSSLFAGFAPDGTKVLRHVKSNYAALGPTLAWEVDDDNKLNWLGAYDDAGLLGQHYTGTSMKQEAIVFLKAMLKDGPLLATELLKLAQDEGISKRTLDRAKRGVAESYLDQSGEKPVWYWRLAAPLRATQRPTDAPESKVENKQDKIPNMESGRRDTQPRTSGKGDSLPGAAPIADDREVAGGGSGSRSEPPRRALSPDEIASLIGGAV